jgi:hypothetical protein
MVIWYEQVCFVSTRMMSVVGAVVQARERNIRNIRNSIMGDHVQKFTCGVEGGCGC